MPNVFREKISTALANEGLQAALDGNAERRRNARQQAYASLPEDLSSLRQKAHQVRLGVIENLETHLASFSEHAQANGIQIHLAPDAAAAVQIVLEIAQQHQARLVAKSKTMVGEEIEINVALEAAGIKVVETDLGEYIVQLRGEHPAHIITPAVHLRRGDVGRTFEEKLGLPYTEDIPTLTSTARRVLRQTFLDADLGISGVNFGVAESGSLCLLTNEGNGRMVTTVPKVHVALMGIERLVPTFDDLALLLSLLPRSATGQKLTVYTTLLHSPRRTTDPDGPQERHLVLLDNGRRALRQSPLAEALGCIRCGACLNACPIFRELGGHGYLSPDGRHTPYPGPIGSVISAGLFGYPEFAHLARASSLCGACKEACPVDIDLPHLLLRIRAGEVHTRAGGAAPGPRQASTPLSQPAPSLAPTGLRWGIRLFGWAAGSPGRFRMAQRMAGLFGRLKPGGWLRLPNFTGWGQVKDFPMPAGRSFQVQWQELQQQQAAPRSFQVQWQELQQRPAPTANSTTPIPATPAVPAAPPAPKTDPEAPTDLLERFCAELTLLGGSFALCNETSAAQEALDWLQERRITTLQSWSAAHLPDGLLEALQAAGIQITHAPDPSVRAGLTSALAAAADTATLALPGGEGRPLTASLLPEKHLVILRAADLLPSLSDVLRLPEIHQASAVALVSGPSRTADIEMTLTIGVHGPGEVHVICVQ